MERGKRKGRAAAAPVVVLLAMLSLAFVPDSAHAASTVNSIPGEVVITLDRNESHTVVVSDAVNNKNPGPTFFFGLAGLAAISAAEAETIAIGEAGGPEVAGLIAALVLLKHALERGERERQEPKYVIEVTDFEHPIIAYPPGASQNCRQKVRDATVLKSFLPNTVECDVVPSLDPRTAGAGPWLVGTGGDFVDHIKLDLKCVVCFGKKLIYGEPGDDVLTGSSTADELVGEEGNDWIFGRGGDDWIMGAHGHTDFEAIVDDPPYPNDQPDNDKLFGGGGSDVILGYKGDDLIAGGAGSDNRTLHLQQHSLVNLDPRFPPTIDVSLYGGSGNDIIVGGTGTDRMEGGSDRDLLLAKESDFGGLDQVDHVDCGPNYARPVAGKEPYRVSKFSDGALMDFKLDSCNEELTKAVGAKALWDWVAGTAWPH